jgi:hypothetical protein
LRLGQKVQKVLRPNRLNKTITKYPRPSPDGYAASSRSKHSDMAQKFVAPWLQAAFWDGSEGSHGWIPVTTHENAVAPTGAVRRQLQTRNLHFAVRPVPKVSYSEAFQERICLDYFFPFGPTRCVGVCHNEGRVGILHCR